MVQRIKHILICLVVIFLGFSTIYAEAEISSLQSGIWDPRELWLDRALSSVSVSVDGHDYELSDNDTLHLDYDSIENATVSMIYHFDLEHRSDDYPFETDNIPTDATFQFKIPDGLVPNSYATKDIMINDDGTLVVVGSFTLSEDGMVTLTFNDNINNYSERYAELYIDFSFDKSYVNEEETVEINIPFSEDAPYTITLDFSEDLENVDTKTGETGVYSGDTFIPTTVRPTHANWSILINTDKQSLKDVVVTDTLSNGQTIESIDDIVITQIKKNLNGDKTKTIIDASDLITLNAHGFVLALGDIEDIYLIEYTTKLDQGDRGTSSTLNNSATVESTTTSKETLDADPIHVNWGSINPTITKTGALKKDGSGNTIYDTIVWTIHYNYDEDALGNVILHDILSHGSVNPSTLRIEELTFNSLGNVITRTVVTDYTLSVSETNPTESTLTIQNSNGKAYDITFESSVPLGYEGKVINTVDDENPLTEGASGSVNVNTIPTGTKVANQKIENGIPYIAWTITINPQKINVGTISLVDLYNSNYFNLVDGSFVLTRNNVTLNSNQYTIDTNYVHTSNDALNGQHGFKLTLNNAGAATYVLKYRTTYTDLGIQQPQVANDAKIFFYAPDGDSGNGTGTPSGETGILEATITGPKAGISKDGRFLYDETIAQGDQYIEWTVKFNSSRLILKNAVLTDTINANLSFINYSTTKHLKISYRNSANVEIELVEGVDYTLNWNLNSKVFVLSFTHDTLATEYTIVYITSAPVDNVTTNNTVSLTWHGATESTSKTLNPRELTATKTSNVRTEGTNRYIDWTITFNSQKNVIKNLVFTDTMQPLTSTIVPPVQLYEVNGQVETLVPTSLYTISNHDTSDSGYSGPGFVLTIPKTNPVVYRIKYTTKLAPKDELVDTINKLTYAYTGHPTPSQTTNTVSKRTLQIDKNAIQILNKDSLVLAREIEWQVVVNSGLMNLVNPVYSDTANTDQKILANTIVIERLTSSGYVNITNSLTLSTSDQTFSVDLPDGPYQYRVTYRSEIIEYPYRKFQGYESQEGYFNLAIITDNLDEENKIIARDFATIKYYQNNQNNNPSKSGVQNEQTDIIDWNVTLNPDRQPIKDGTIFDQLGNDNTTSLHHFIKESLVVWLVTPTGEAVEVSPDNYVITYSDAPLKSFTLTFKDFTLDVGGTTYTESKNQINNTYKLTYQTELDVSVKGIITVVNNAGIRGYSNYSWTETVRKEVRTEKWYIGTASDGSKVPLSIQKNDSLSNKPIANVEFTLQRVNGVNNTVTNTYASLITDENGLITTNVRAGRYLIKEIKTPTGYVSLPSNLDLKLIIERDANGATQIILNDATWMSNNPALTSVNGQLVITNDRLVGSVNATKRWNNLNAPTAPNNPTIWLQLWRTDSNNVTEKVPNEAVKKLVSGVETVTWTNILLYDENVEAYTFFVKEVDADGNLWTPNGYTTTTNGLTLTNTYDSPTISIPVTKAWIDYANKLSTRPSTVSVNAVNTKTNQVLGTLVLSAPLWSGTFTSLPKYDKAGELISYTLKESTPTGYSDSLSGTMDGFELTNTYTHQVQVDGTKVWDDDNNRDGLRPESIEVTLYVQSLENDEIVSLPLETKTVTPDDSGNWTFSFTGLPYGPETNPFVYTVGESEVHEYIAVVTQDDQTLTMTITNTHTPQSTQVDVTKVWVDDDDYDALRDDVVIRLLEDGVFKGKTITLTNDTHWMGSFENLDKFKPGSVGVEVVYTLEEVSLDGYDSTITGTQHDGFVVTNTHKPEETTISVTKTWVDDDNYDALREAVEITLYKDGQPTDQTRILSEENNWTASFDHLYLYEPGGQMQPVVYTVVETSVTGYTNDVTKTSSDQFNVTNTHTPDKTQVVVSKVWDDDDDYDALREAVEITLYKDGQPTDQTRILSEENNWTASFDDLYLYRPGGQHERIEYTVKETDLDGYLYDITGSHDDGYKVTNVHMPEKTSVTVSKTWVDDDDYDALRHGVEVTLYADGEATGETRILSQETNWMASFDNLYLYRPGGNHEQILYTVNETEVEGYTSEITGSQETGYVITNTHTPLKTSVPVSKVWVDEDNRDALRHAVEVTLYADGEATHQTLIVSDENNWTVTFDDLYLYKPGGNQELISYTVEETQIEGYSAGITGSQEAGYVITNTHIPEKTQVSITKVWDDDANRDNLRTAVEITLLIDGKVSDQTVMLSQENNWTASFDDLYLYRPGGDHQRYQYTVIETPLEGYTSTITGSVDQGYVITNTHIPQT
ncbi:Cna B-type domain-containing protein [Erysipelothrix larvae]|uniref:Cna B-type domain-containing protein n=1 Tax=Erysipelothrix larvae TaxID=1514105 RepID=UPI0018E0807C|nr:Cna B-type domain-containing protein [Erysipelothrix larvae]